MNKLTVILLTIIIITVTTLGFFFSKSKALLYDNQNTEKFDREVSVFPSSSPKDLSSSPSAAPSPPNLNKAQLETVIRNQINAKNYISLTNYMKTPSVEVTLMSTDCCGSLSPEETATQMGYINNGVPFEFNQNSPEVTNVKKSNAKFNGYFLGVSTKNEQIIGFSINNSNQIEKIEMSQSYKLYVY